MELANLRPKLHLTLLFFVLLLTIGVTFLFLAFLSSDTQLSLLGYGLLICTCIGFGLREIIVFLVILWKKAEDNRALLFVGLRAGICISFGLMAWNFSGFPPFSFRYNSSWFQITYILDLTFTIIAVSIPIIHTIAWGKFPPALSIGMGWISQWPFNEV
ncbi:MAG: hypothetical protein ACFFCZ_16480 [Promethearchaeota archaeon]